MLYILIISIFYCIIVNCNDASLQERTFWLHHCQYFKLVGWFGYEICGPTRLLLSFTHMFLGSKLNFFGFGPCRPLKRISFITQVSSIGHRFEVTQKKNDNLYMMNPFHDLISKL